jgi:hypothetical protein
MMALWTPQVRSNEFLNLLSTGAHLLPSSLDLTRSSCFRAMRSVQRLSASMLLRISQTL